jgi:glutathione-regulated potassium-efflux system protein KefB
LQLDQLVFAALLLLAVSGVLVTISRALRLGSILGLITAGIALGPHSPGPVLTDHVDELLSIGELGVVLFLFTIGLEMRPARIWALRRLMFGLGAVQFVATVAALLALIRLLSPFPWPTDVVLAVGLTMSSTAIAMQTLADRAEQASEHGRAAFGVSIFEDMVAVPCLVALPLIAHVTTAQSGTPFVWKALGVAGALVGIGVIGRMLVPYTLAWTARRTELGIFGLIVLAGVLAAALLSDKAGLDMAMGAFLLGVLLADSDYRHQIEANVEPLKRVFMGLFFFAVGMSIDVDLVIEAGWRLPVGVLAMMAIKVVLLGGIALAFGVRRPAATRLAFLLSQAGEFSFVLFAAAFADKLLTEHEFAVALAAVAMSMAATPLMMALGDRLAGRWDKAPLPPSGAAAPPDDEPADRVILVGLGRIGRTVALMLQRTDTPYAAFEIDLDHVVTGRKAGFAVHFGDATDLEFLRTVGLEQARTVVIALEDAKASAGLVDDLRRFYPKVKLQVAVDGLQAREAMRARGVHDVVSLSTAGGLQLGRLALIAAGVPDTVAGDLVDTLQADDYAALVAALPPAAGPPGSPAVAHPPAKHAAARTG